jgi:hypothetical protein
MIAEVIGFVLRNLPAFLLVAAVLIAAGRRDGRSAAERLLGWILLLPIGATGLWAAIFHLFFPDLSAADIGWEPSPFQFEVGMADLAFGATAVASFWCSLQFKAAVVWVSAILLLGDAVGHVHQMLAAGNFASGNAGTPFFMDVIAPVLASVLLARCWRSQARSGAARPRTSVCQGDRSEAIS